ncbi:uncharacterized protein [Miscanthus floridulus]|uniref:uncharacterized protein isoform X2 n=1 Tax=Miscanthus floridulus TaxID=154761 RepID=UPI00345B3214
MRGLPLTESVARSSSAIARGLEIKMWGEEPLLLIVVLACCKKVMEELKQELGALMVYVSSTTLMRETLLKFFPMATYQNLTLQCLTEFGAFYNMQYVKMVAGYSSSTKFQMHVLIVQLKSRLSRSQKVISSRRCGPMIVPASSPIPNPNAKGALSTESVSFTC